MKVLILNILLFSASVYASNHMDNNKISTYKRMVYTVFDRIHEAQINHDFIWQVEDSRTPNPTRGVTQQGLILVVNMIDQRSVLSKLYTPLGSYDLFPGGDLEAMIRISEEVISAENWEMTDVTDTIRAYRTSGLGPYAPPMEPWAGSGMSLKYFILTRVGDLDIPQDENPQFRSLFFN